MRVINSLRIITTLICKIPPRLSFIKGGVNPHRQRGLQKPAYGINQKQMIIVIFLTSFALYLNTLVNGFVFDDILNVVNNKWIKSISYIPDVFSSHLAGFDKGVATNYYRPLVHLVYMFNYHVFGLGAWGFHLINVVFHVAVCIVVFLLTSTLLRRSGVSPSANSLFPAFMAAILFAAHPIHTEAVAWVAGIMDLSFTFFYLLSFYLYLRSFDSDSHPYLKHSYLLSVSSFFIAAFFKEPALTLPLILVAYDYSFRQGEFKLRDCLQRYLPYGVAAVIYLAARMNALGGFAPARSEVGLTHYQLILNILVLFSEYLEKLLVPINLNVYHIFHPITSLFTVKGMISLLIISAILVLAFVIRKKDKVIFFGLLMLVIPLLPSLYIPALSQGVEKSFLGERYLYLPSFGFVLVLGELAARLLRSRGRRAVVLTIVASALMVWYSAGTTRRNGVWRDNYSLWSDTVKKSPDTAFSRGNLGYALYLEDRLDEAIEQYQIALSLKPNLIDERLNLGVAFHRKGLLDRAVEQYRIVLNSRPNSPEAHSNLGLALLDKGWIEQGMDHCRRALTFDPDLADAHHNLGIGYARKGQLNEAIQEFQIAVNLNPNNMNFKKNLAKALLEADRFLGRLK